MTSRKDLAEARAFARRRLLTAFLCGAPGGREIEPARPGRATFGGAAIALLLVAGAVTAPALSTHHPQGRAHVGCVGSAPGAPTAPTGPSAPHGPSKCAAPQPAVGDQ